MAAHARDELPPEDAARLTRWHAAGRPPIPLVTDTTGQVHATTTNLATLLRSRAPVWASLRETAVRWVDKHCPA